MKANSSSIQAPSRLTFKHFLYFFLPLYTTYYFYILANHELWRDEIQPWGVAASSHDIGDLFSKMEYEGRPPLWQLILFLVSRVSMDPNSLKFIAAGIFICNTLIVLSLKKFPASYRIILLLGFYFIYGYSVTSRDYNLILMLHLATMKYFENTKRRQPIFLLLILSMGLVNGYGLILVAFWIAVALQEFRAQKISLRKYIPILSVGFAVFVIQQIFKPPFDSVFATHLKQISLSEIKRAISNVFVFPFLPIHHEQPPSIFLMIVATLILILLAYLILKIKRSYQIALIPTFTFSLLNSFFGYYLYWWHFGSIFLILLASIYASFENQKQRNGFKYGILVLFSLQIIGTIFGSGKDFESTKTYSNIANASDYIQKNCTNCVVLTDSSVFGSPIASFIRPTKVYALDTLQFVDFAIWKKTYMREVDQIEIEEEALKFDDVLVVTSQSKLLNPAKFKLVKTFSGSVWGDDYRIYKSVINKKGNYR